MTPSHIAVSSPAPAAVTLGVMGRTAIAASSTFPFREWAARLATRAPPRDYVGQLRELYRGILERWRYVQEPEEWIHGSPESLIAHVLGTKYNTDEHPLSVRLEQTPSDEKGWGDCDDISTVVAAAAIALGMRPYFRVAKSPSGAHVSVVVETPAGDRVSVDPVGHPTYPFGWELPSDDVQLFPVELAAQQALSGIAEGPAMEASTVFSGVDGSPRQFTRSHWCAVPRNDVAGPRALAMPMRHYRSFLRGLPIDGTPAFDERGNGYRYDAARDLWVDQRLHNTRLGSIDRGFGGVSEKRKRIRARRRRVVRRIVQKVRGAIAKVIDSPVAQGLVGAALQVYGVPSRLTRGVMEAAAHILKEGGIPALIRLLKKDPKAAAKLVAAAAKKGAGEILPIKAFGGVDDSNCTYCVSQDGSRPFYAQPVLALAGVPGLYAFGDLDIAPAPTPGRWYRIQRGDTLYAVAGRAYGVPAGGTRVERARWINRVAANQYAFDPSLTDNFLKDGRISFNPRYHADPEQAIRGEPGSSYAVIWIPTGPGDEPPEITPDVTPETPDVEIPPEIEDETPVEPPDPETPELPEVTPDIEPPEPEVDEIPPVDTTPDVEVVPETPEVEDEVVPPIEPPEPPTTTPDVEIPPVDTTPDEVIPDVTIPPRPQIPEVIPPQIPDEVIPDVTIPPRPQIPDTWTPPQTTPGSGGFNPMWLLALLALTGDLDI